MKQLILFLDTNICWNIFLFLNNKKKIGQLFDTLRYADRYLDAIFRRKKCSDYINECQIDSRMEEEGERGD